MSIKDRLWNGQSYPTLPRSSNASPATESENNRPADQGAIGELRAEASSLITMRDLNGQRMISAKFNHVFSIFQFPIMLCIWGGQAKIQDGGWIRENISWIKFILFSCKEKQKWTLKDLQDIGTSFGKAWEECVDKYCLQFIKNSNKLLKA